MYTKINDFQTSFKKNHVWIQFQDSVLFDSRLPACQILNWSYLSPLPTACFELQLVREVVLSNQIKSNDVTSTNTPNNSHFGCEACFRFTSFSCFHKIMAAIVFKYLNFSFINLLDSEHFCKY